MSAAASVETMAREAIIPVQGVALGAPYLGVCFDSLLLGVILCQMTHWIPNATYDDRHVRLLVVVAATAALIGSAFTWATYMTAFVYEFGFYTRFISFEFFGWYGVLDILVVVPVQVIFAERSFRINNNSILLAIINAVMICATAATAVSVTVVSRGHNLFTRPELMVMLATAWPAVCTSTHIWITSSIVYGLVTSRTSSSRANKLLSRLMAISIESQLPSTLVAIIMMAIIISDNKSPIIPFIAIVHPKVFLVGLLAMVNLRHSWRTKGKTPTVYVDTELSRSRPRTGVFASSLGSTTEDMHLGTPKQNAFDFGVPHPLQHAPSRTLSEAESAQGYAHGLELEVKEDVEAGPRSGHPFAA